MEPVPGTEEALAELAATGDTTVAEAVITMGQRAQDIVPECVGLSVTFLQDGLTFTLEATSDEMAVLDAVQYLDGGPCLKDLERDLTIEVTPEELLDEKRWQMYASASAAAGVESSLSLPVVRDDTVVAGLNLYGSTPDAFDGRHEELADALGGLVEGAVTNADLGFVTRDRAAEAPKQLADRRDIDVAVGIIAASQSLDTDTAEQRLQEAAERVGISVAQAARAVKNLGVI